ncbi:metallophosphoesterase [Thauera humireducens]|uniref:metallophosphoesterase n=1 Tax=Thauera humireducens TaxID=1134435 RepID=UPI00311DE6F5
MSVLLHISDTHFGTEEPRVVEALVTLAAQQRPDVVVLSGDITQRARPAQFRAAKTFADRLGALVLAVPGNHDIALFDLWARFTHPYARYAKAFGSDLEPVPRFARPPRYRRQHHAPMAVQERRSVRGADRSRGCTAGRRQRAAVARGGGPPACGRHQG